MSARTAEPSLGEARCYQLDSALERLSPAERAASAIFLGWQRTEAGLDGQQRDFFVRQLRDWKLSLKMETMIPHGTRQYGNRTAGRWREHKPAPEAASRSPPTSAAPTCSTGPSPSSPPPAPIRTSATISPRRRLRTHNRRARHMRHAAGEAAVELDYGDQPLAVPGRAAAERLQYGT